MIGWHWTGEENWSDIQTDGGMHEYPLNKIEISSLLVDDYGIFIFPDGPESDLDEMGCALFHMQTKEVTRVVLLHIEYERADIKKPSWFEWDGPDSLLLTHNGSLGDGWVYHDAKPMWVLRGPIPVERITLVKTYDMNDLLTHARRPSPETGPTADADHPLGRVPLDLAVQG